MTNIKNGKAGYCPQTSKTSDIWVSAADFGASGSEFATIGGIKAGTSELELEDIGDFAPQQWITAEGCFPHIEKGMVYNDRDPALAKSRKPLENEVEIDFSHFETPRNYQIFVIHFMKPDSFNWMAVDPKYQTLATHEPILNRLWCWQGEDIPVTNGWHELLDGVSIRFSKTNWKAGESVSFHVRNRLYARILEVRNEVLVLDRTASVCCDNAKVKHNDNAALQLALDRAVAEKKPLFIPAGRYRLNSGLWIKHSSVRIEGAGRENTILDVSEDQTACFWIAGGKCVEMRNFGMEGHTGFLELPSNTCFKTATGFNFWPTANEEMQVCGCAAVNAVSTEFMLFEDLNVTRMCSEAFYLHGSDRFHGPPYIQDEHENIPGLDRQYQKQCIFHRCRVWNRGFNAFNNNDHSENTEILYCHVENVSNFYESASRFTRLIGNYAYNCCASNHIGQRYKERLAQTVISGNVFEGGFHLGGIELSGRQIIVSDNVFSGFSKETAVFVSGAGKVIFKGNIVDLTHEEGNPDRIRDGIEINASDVIIADNQIVNRNGLPDEKITAIAIGPKTHHADIHDNFIENCGYGIRHHIRRYDAEKKQWFYDSPPPEGTDILIRIRDNSFRNCLVPFDVQERNGVYLQNNLLGKK